MIRTIPVTPTIAKVVRAMEPYTAPVTGGTVARETGLQCAHVCAALKRMEQACWVYGYTPCQRYRENRGLPTGRPARRYRLTRFGRAQFHWRAPPAPPTPSPTVQAELAP